MVIPAWILLLLVIIAFVNIGWLVIVFLIGAAVAFGVGCTIGLVEILRKMNERERARQAKPRKPPVPAHWKTLGLKPSASEDQINDRYRELARKAHPDAGGTEKAMLKLNLARDLARREIKERRGQ